MPPQMFKKIMIAVDGSEASKAAAREGLDLAKRSGARAVAVYVADLAMLNRLSDYIIYPGANDEVRKLMIKQGHEATDEIEKMAKELGLEIEKVVAEGSPAAELLRLSQGTGADLLVLASSGKGGVEKFLLGSVAEKVIRNSKVPVMMVPTNRD